MIFAVDPGPDRSGWCVYDSDDGVVYLSGVDLNANVLILMESYDYCDLAVEMIASYGMAVGKSVFNTCVWVGRFGQHWAHVTGKTPRLVYRSEVKKHLCRTMRAKDKDIRAALIAKLGEGKTKGVKSHAWAALGVAVTAAETEAPCLTT
jgi:hypothetical protein